MCFSLKHFELRGSSRTHVYPLVDEIGVVELVVLRDVVLGELCQLKHLRHDLLLLVGVANVHQQGHDAVSAI